MTEKASSQAMIMLASISFFGRNRSGNNKNYQNNVAELKVKANTCTSSLVFLSSCYLKAHLESRRPFEGSYFSVARSFKTLSNDDGDGNKNGKKAIGLHQQLSLPSSHDYDVKLPIFTLYGEREYKETIFYFFNI